MIDWLNCYIGPKFHLARLDSTRLDTFDFVASRASRDERVEPCCSNMADDEQAIVLACISLVVFMLLHTQILFVSSNKIHYINVYSNKLVNNLHSITLYKLHNKLSCVSSESRRTCRAWRVCRAVLFQRGGRRRSSSACVYKFHCLCFVRTCK